MHRTAHTGYTALQRRKKSRGAAMVESTVISLFVAVPVFYGIWYLGKFHDVQYSTIQAARYAAWERVSQGDSANDSTITQQARSRLFTWNHNAFKSDDGANLTGSWNNGKPSDLWQNDKAKYIIEKPESITVGTSNAQLPGMAPQTIDTIINGLENTLGAITGGEKLNTTGGLYTGDVSVKLIDFKDMSDNLLPKGMTTLQLTLHETNTVASDSWDSSGPDQVAARTRSFAPASLFDRVKPLFEALDWALSFIEPAFSEFKPGQICPDIVPQDRVSGGGNLQAYNGGGACVW